MPEGPPSGWLGRPLPPSRCASASEPTGLHPHCQPVVTTQPFSWPCCPSLQAIPEIGDYTIKKQRRIERFAPVPDSLLSRAAAEASGSAANMAKSLDPTNGLASVGFNGLATPMGGATSTVSDLTAIGTWGSGGRAGVWSGVGWGAGSLWRMGLVMRRGGAEDV
jgi:hypothetical protein